MLHVSGNLTPEVLQPTDTVTTNPQKLSFKANENNELERTPSADSYEKKGMSTGAKIGIGVLATTAVLAAADALFNKSRCLKRIFKGKKAKPELPEGSGLPNGNKLSQEAQEILDKTRQRLTPKSRKLSPEILDESLAPKQKPGAWEPKDMKAYYESLSGRKMENGLMKNADGTLFSGTVENFIGENARTKATIEYKNGKIVSSTLVDNFGNTKVKKYKNGKLSEKTDRLNVITDRHNVITYSSKNGVQTRKYYRLENGKKELRGTTVIKNEGVKGDERVKEQYIRPGSKTPSSECIYTIDGQTNVHIGKDGDKHVKEYIKVKNKDGFTDLGLKDCYQLKPDGTKIDMRPKTIQHSTKKGQVKYIEKYDTYGDHTIDILASDGKTIDLRISSDGTIQIPGEYGDFFTGYKLVKNGNKVRLEADGIDNVVIKTLKDDLVELSSSQHGTSTYNLKTGEYVGDRKFFREKEWIEELFGKGKYKSLEDFYNKKNQAAQKALEEVANPKLKINETIHCV